MLSPVKGDCNGSNGGGDDYSEHTIAPSPAGLGEDIGGDVRCYCPVHEEWKRIERGEEGTPSQVCDVSNDDLRENHSISELVPED